MSVHKSLRISAGSSTNRSVLSRAERVSILLKDGRLKAGQAVLGLPKTRVDKVKAKGKTKKKEDAAAPAGGAAAAPAAAAAAAPAAKATKAEKPKK